MGYKSTNTCSNTRPGDFIEYEFKDRKKTTRSRGYIHGNIPVPYGRLVSNGTCHIINLSLIPSSYILTDARPNVSMSRHLDGYGTTRMIRQILLGGLVINIWSVILA